MEKKTQDLKVEFLSFELALLAEEMKETDF